MAGSRQKKPLIEAAFSFVRSVSRLPTLNCQMSQIRIASAHAVRSGPNRDVPARQRTKRRVFLLRHELKPAIGGSRTIGECDHLIKGKGRG